MKNIILSLIAGLLFLTMLFGQISCGGDDSTIPPVITLNPYANLQQRDDVLANLELAYNQRNINEFDRLLDEAFIFHFSPKDISQGNVAVPDWDRSSETGATTHMFNPSFVPPAGAPVSSIDLTLTYPAREDEWRAIAPPDTNLYPNEVWYEKTVFYLLSVVAGHTTYTSGRPIDALIVVREADVDGKKFYRIAIWKDLATLRSVAHASAATEETTWGSVKALYAE